MNSAGSNVCSAASMAGSQCRRPVVARADRYGRWLRIELAELPLLTEVFAIPRPRGPGLRGQARCSRRPMTVPVQHFGHIIEPSSVH
jgi:hypothetical protein